MFCPNCVTQNADTNKFCFKCGNALPASVIISSTIQAQSTTTAPLQRPVNRAKEIVGLLIALGVVIAIIVVAASVRPAPPPQPAVFSPSGQSTSSGSSQPTPQSEDWGPTKPGVYLKTGRIQLTRVRTMTPAQTGLLQTNETRPVIFVNLPGEETQYLQFMRISGTKRDMGFDTLAYENGLYTIQPSSDLASGVYCVVLGGPLMMPTDVSWWCFQIGQTTDHSRPSLTSTQSSRTPTPASVEPSLFPTAAMRRPATYQILVAGNNGVFIINLPSGKTSTTLSTRATWSAERLPNGNILVADSVIRELNIEGQAVRRVSIKSLDGYLYAGATDTESVWTFTGCTGKASATLKRIDWSGHELFSIGNFHCASPIRLTSQGNLLVPDGSGILKEISPAGEVVRTISLSNWTQAVTPLPNGAILIGRPDGIALVGSSNTELWFTPMNRILDIEWLPWGNMLIRICEQPDCNTPKLEEIAPNGTIVQSIELALGSATVRYWPDSR